MALANETFTNTINRLITLDRFIDRIYYNNLHNLIHSEYFF